MQLKVRETLPAECLSDGGDKAIDFSLLREELRKRLGPGKTPAEVDATLLLMAKMALGRAKSIYTQDSAENVFRRQAVMWEDMGELVLGSRETLDQFYTKTRTQMSMTLNPFPRQKGQSMN